MHSSPGVCLGFLFPIQLGAAGVGTSAAMMAVGLLICLWELYDRETQSYCKLQWSAGGDTSLLQAQARGPCLVKRWGWGAAPGNTVWSPLCRVAVACWKCEYSTQALCDFSTLGAASTVEGRSRGTISCFWELHLTETQSYCQWNVQPGVVTSGKSVQVCSNLNSWLLRRLLTEGHKAEWETKASLKQA